jgi:peptidoglycan/LPS O-acetylase OafA/YrhL
VRSTRKRSVVLEPLRWLGRRSYEVYLTHMFVVMGFFHLFVAAGRHGGAVTPLFLAVVVFSGILGGIVARYFSDPLNRMLRHHWE